MDCGFWRQLFCNIIYIICKMRDRQSNCLYQSLQRRQIPNDKNAARKQEIANDANASHPPNPYLMPLRSKKPLKTLAKCLCQTLPFLARAPKPNKQQLWLQNIEPPNPPPEPSRPPDQPNPKYESKHKPSTTQPPNTITIKNNKTPNCTNHRWHSLLNDVAVATHYKSPCRPIPHSNCLRRLQLPTPPAHHQTQARPRTTQLKKCVLEIARRHGCSAPTRRVADVQSQADFTATINKRTPQPPHQQRRQQL